MNELIQSTLIRPESVNGSSYAEYGKRNVLRQIQPSIVSAAQSVPFHSFN